MKQAKNIREDQVTICLPAVEGDRVLVENYKSIRKPWETGTVTRVEIAVYRDGRCHIGYSVRLDRKTPQTARNPYPRALSLYVSVDSIRRIELAERKPSMPCEEAPDGQC